MVRTRCGPTIGEGASTATADTLRLSTGPGKNTMTVPTVSGGWKHVSMPTAYRLVDWSDISVVTNRSTRSIAPDTCRAANTRDGQLREFRVGNSVLYRHDEAVEPIKGMATTGHGTNTRGMTSIPVLTAWVDESIHAAMRTANGTMTDGMYILAAVIADSGTCEPIREELRRLLPGRAKRLHWRDENPRRRRVIAGALAGLDVTHVMVVGIPVDPHRQERARRLCLERLLHELNALGVTRVWVETRTESLNKRDIRMIDALRSAGTLPDRVAIGFADPVAEPMLWLPDAVAGAVGAHRRGTDHEPYEMLRQAMTEHTITLT